MTKAELRSLFKNKRKQLSSQEWEEKSTAIVEHFLASEYSQKSTWHCFLPMVERKEVNTLPIIEHGLAKGKKIVVPKVEGKNMSSCLLEDMSGLEKSDWGIMEPAFCIPVDETKIEVVIMPLLTMDKNGNRVGYGGGFYDRFLKRCSADVLTVGVCFFEPIDKIDGIHNQDMPIDAVITPRGITVF